MRNSQFVMRNYLALRITVSLYKNYSLYKKIAVTISFGDSNFLYFYHISKAKLRITNYELMISFSHTTARVI